MDKFWQFIDDTVNIAFVVGTIYEVGKIVRKAIRTRKEKRQ